MRQQSFWIGGSCVLAMVVLFPFISSSASATSTETVLYSFTGSPDGAGPLSNLTADSAGNLYGTTSGGGRAGFGTVFELKHSANGWSEHVLYSFAGGADGIDPEAGVIFDGSGNLYGTTASGGTGYVGTVFKLAPNGKGGWTETVIYAFKDIDGSKPQTNLVFDSRGNLYGTTHGGGGGGNACYFFSGCGAVFQLVPQSDGSWKERTIYAFASQPDGAIPSSGVILDALGNLYGVTEVGGTGSCFIYFYGINGEGKIHGCGIVYKLAPNSGGGWTESVIYNFFRSGGFGVFPSGELLLDKADHLLGITGNGGDGLGVVFELNNSQKRGWQQNVLHLFYGYPIDGANPTVALVADPDGDRLFGVTPYAGPNRFGVVFELRPSDRLEGEGCPQLCQWRRRK
jgi:uncharacterized repeat protein (TIGR03803 family)